MTAVRSQLILSQSQGDEWGSHWGAGGSSSQKHGLVLMDRVPAKETCRSPPQFRPSETLSSMYHIPRWEVWGPPRYIPAKVARSQELIRTVGVVRVQAWKKRPGPVFLKGGCTF